MLNSPIAYSILSLEEKEINIFLKVIAYFPSNIIYPSLPSFSQYFYLIYLLYFQSLKFYLCYRCYVDFLQKILKNFHFYFYFKWASNLS